MGKSYQEELVNIYESAHDKISKWHVRRAKTQISLGIRPVWSESSLCAQWVAKDPNFLHADSENSDQTGRMPRLIWVFARRTCPFICSVRRWLICLARFRPLCGSISITYCTYWPHTVKVHKRIVTLLKYHGRVERHKKSHQNMTMTFFDNRGSLNSILFV